MRNNSILLPPPNITGVLHIGHAFQQTLMDVIAKQHEIHKSIIDWTGGVDHAGIAGQLMIEKSYFNIYQTQISDLPKADKISFAYKYYEEALKKIIQQTTKLGFSIDWSNSRFTMDNDFQDAIIEAFVRLYNANLIYRGTRMIYFDPSIQTVISDLEVQYVSQENKLFTIEYDLVASASDKISVSTTRPETLFGDTAIAVNPQDERYNLLIGKKVLVPLINRTIPIIADTSVDIHFGTGCVKVTPGHSIVDFEIAKKYNLDVISVLDSSGKICNNAPDEYIGLTFSQAREIVLLNLKEQNRLLGHTVIHSEVPVGDRSGTVLENFITTQWFLKATTLAKQVQEIIDQKRIKFYPSDWANKMHQWLENTQDWCISRQIWWGHQIPAWYDSNGQYYVGTSEQQVRADLQDSHIVLTQETDVLDTWFSSAIWPMAIMGWPKSSYQIPHTYLITGHDILFFWVIRMAMLTLVLCQEVPVRKVIVTGIIRDNLGNKMSKTLGNVIDPIDIVDAFNSNYNSITAESNQILHQIKEKCPERSIKFGSDIMRFTFIKLHTPTISVNFDVSQLKGSAVLCNKILNLSRFCKLHCDGYNSDNSQQTIIYEPAIWIVTKLYKLINKLEMFMKDFKFALIAQYLQDFVLHSYCAFYLEFTKIDLKREFVKRNVLTEKENSDNRVDIVKEGLILSSILLSQILYPYMPLVSQDIFSSTSSSIATNTKDTLVSFEFKNEFHSQALKRQDISDMFDIIVQFIKDLRVFRITVKNLEIIVHTTNNTISQAIQNGKHYIKCMTHIKNLTFSSIEPSHYHEIFPNYIISTLTAHSYADLDENNTIKRQKNNLLNRLKSLEILLANSSFVDKASDSIQKQKEKELLEIKERLANLK